MGPGQVRQNIKVNDWSWPKNGGTVILNMLQGSGDAGMYG